MKKVSTEPGAWVLVSPDGRLRKLPLLKRLQTWPPTLALPADRYATERYLANARIFLAVAALASIYIDPSEPSRFPGIAYLFLWAYVVFSLLVRPFVAMPRLHGGGAYVTHGIDVVFPCLLMFVSEGPSSPFFVLLPFALLAAAYRWGYAATLATGAIGILVLFIDAAIVWTRLGPAALHSVPLDPTSFMLRAIYLAVLTIMIGYLSERSHRARAQSAYVAHLFGLVRARQGTEQLLMHMAEELTRLFDARGALFAVLDATHGRGTLWIYDADDRDSGTGLRSAPLAMADKVIYLTEDAPTGDLMRDWRSAIFERHRCDALIAANVPLGEAIRARVFLVDPAIEPAAGRKLRFLETLLGQVGPAMYGGYLRQRLRSRVAASEREWLARELHDGIVQSLLGQEFQLESCLRRDDDASALRAGIAEIRDGLRGVIQESRDLIGDLQRHKVTPRNIGFAVRRMAMRLQRETGIAVEVLGLGGLVDCTNRGAQLLASVVQEALGNIRKHSGAAHVAIHYMQDGARQRLIIADDGKGFPFDGVLSGPELERSVLPPAALQERVRALYGTLSIESNRGAGARIVVEWPRASA